MKGKTVRSGRNANVTTAAAKIVTGYRISPAANKLWMDQIARNLTDSVDGLLMGKRYLIHDRDPLFTDGFLRTLKDAGIDSVKLPARSPNLNAHAERFVRSIKESSLERLILFGESSLRTAVQNFVAHYHSERNHQGLATRGWPTG